MSKKNAPYFKDKESARDYVRNQLGAISSKLHRTLETIEKWELTEYQSDSSESFHSLDFQLRYAARNMLAMYAFYHQNESWDQFRHMFTSGNIHLPKFVLDDLLLSMREHNQQLP